MMIADNLIKCNHHFRALNATWKSQGRDARWSRVKVACRFTRILYQMVAGQQVFRHPSQLGRGYVLDKLFAFHRQHATPPDALLMDLKLAIDQIPKSEYHNEADPLQAHYKGKRTTRRRSAQPIGDILPLVLARLGVGTVKLESEDRDSS